MNKKFLVLLATCAVASAAIPLAGCATGKVQRGTPQPTTVQSEAYDYDEEEPDYDEEYEDEEDEEYDEEDGAEEMRLSATNIFGKPRTTLKAVPTPAAKPVSNKTSKKAAKKTTSKKTTKKITAKKTVKTSKSAPAIHRSPGNSS